LDSSLHEETRTGKVRRDVERRYLKPSSGSMNSKKLSARHGNREKIRGGGESLAVLFLKKTGAARYHHHNKNS